MIHFFVGENTFAIAQAVHKLSASFGGEVVKVDGADISPSDIPNLLMGTTLFSDKRLVILRDASSNTLVWSTLPDWMTRLSDDVTLVIIETKPDKRTTTFKALKAAGEYREFPVWTDRDIGAAEVWLQKRAEAEGLLIDARFIRLIVQRAGVDQWTLSSVLETLSLADRIDEQAIIDLVPAHPAENIFNLFETALVGNTKKLHTMIRTLELTEDAYRFFALLSSQAFQLAVIHAARDEDTPTKDFGIHPFVASKLAAHARKLSKSDIRCIIGALAKTDADMKLSKADPWLLVERALTTIATK